MHMHRSNSSNGLDTTFQQSAFDRQDEYQHVVLPPLVSTSGVADPADTMVLQSNVIANRQQETGYVNLALATSSHNAQPHQFLNEQELRVAQLAMQMPTASIGSSAGTMARPMYRPIGLQGEAQHHVAQQPESRDIMELNRRLQEHRFFMENRGPRIDQNATRRTFLHKCGACRKRYRTRSQLREHGRRVHRM